MKEKREYKFLFAGGGTGGHLFPAVAVAEKIRLKEPNSQILFVGTKTKIEGRVVPKLGFSFKSIWIKGFSRKITFENLLFPLKLIISIMQSILINMNFRPKVAIGSGGYVSGPAIFGSSLVGAKIILIEQNSYPGVTTRLLERFADEIHISFADTKKYLRKKEKVFLTGNPIRENLKTIEKDTALKEFGLSSGKKTLLVLGGSLGALSINEAVANSVEKLVEADIQIIWQTGKIYYERYKKFSNSNVLVKDFIENMNYAYSACDLLISRAGATTIAEIIGLGIASILIPSPNVAENHQYYNAKSLVDNNAAILIEDREAKTVLSERIKDAIFNKNILSELRANVKNLNKKNAAEIIANNAINYVKANEYK
jgi:UDP-N-acetylglucosamine--N-acetylmuramyl-(pentapeptide) pyrophosphoryl-undecaprenol N-acetylglucosamine transferase